MILFDGSEQELLRLVGVVHDATFQDEPLTESEVCTLRAAVERLRCMVDAEYVECAYGSDDETM